MLKWSNNMSMEKTLADVVAERRCEDEEEIAAGVAFPHIQLQSATANRTGNRLSRLRCMSIDHACITSLSGGRLLAEHCPVLTELNLSNNHLTSWSEVISLLKDVPTLKLLNVGFNPFGKKLVFASQDDAVATGDAEKTQEKQDQGVSVGLQSLILNGTYCPWQVVKDLLHLCPRLEELHLSCNDYKELDVSDLKHTCVKRLHFNNNLVTSWYALEQLGVGFPQLEMLVARANPLRLPQLDSMPASESDDEQSAGNLLPLASVTHIVLTESEIGCVDELFTLVRRCPTLTELRLANVPLVTSLPEDVRREVVIACLPQLARLNGSPITDEETEQAERAFVRHFRNCEDLSGQVKEIFDGLVMKHGLLEPIIDIDLGPPKDAVRFYFSWYVKGTQKQPCHDRVCVAIPWRTSFVSLKVFAAQALGFDTRHAQKLLLYRRDSATTWSEIRSFPGRSMYLLRLEDKEDLLVREPLQRRQR